MTERTIETERQRETFVRFVMQQRLPFTAIIKEGKHRSLEQNRLQRLWCNELSPQLGLTPEEVRGLIKLTIGIPLMREASEAYREKYDRILKPLSYEEKIELMMEPMDLPVTRFMTTKQATEFLDRVFKHFSEKGYEMTLPDEGLLQSAEAA